MKMMNSARHNTINSHLTTSKSNKNTFVARKFREVIRPLLSLSALTKCADGTHLLMSAKLRTIVNQMEREQFFSSFLVKWAVSLWPIQHCIPFYLNPKWYWGMKPEEPSTGTEPSQHHEHIHVNTSTSQEKEGSLRKQRLQEAESAALWQNSVTSSTTLGSVALNAPSYCGLQTFTVTVYSNTVICVLWICLFRYYLHQYFCYWTAAVHINKNNVGLNEFLLHFPSFLWVAWI